MSFVVNSQITLCFITFHSSSQTSTGASEQIFSVKSASRLVNNLPDKTNTLARFEKKFREAFLLHENISNAHDSQRSFWLDRVQSTETHKSEENKKIEFAQTAVQSFALLARVRAFDGF